MTFQVGQRWYLWSGLTWQPYEIRALIDEDIVVWRAPSAGAAGYVYECKTRYFLTLSQQKGQLQPFHPPEPWPELLRGDR